MKIDCKTIFSSLPKPIAMLRPSSLRLPSASSLLLPPPIGELATPSPTSAAARHFLPSRKVSAKSDTSDEGRAGSLSPETAPRNQRNIKTLRKISTAAVKISPADNGGDKLHRKVSANYGGNSVSTTATKCATRKKSAEKGNF